MQTDKSIRTAAMAKLAVMLITIAIIAGITLIAVNIAGKDQTGGGTGYNMAIVAASQCDKFVCALLSDGRLVLFRPDAGVYTADRLVRSNVH